MCGRHSALRARTHHVHGGAREVRALYHALARRPHDHVRVGIQLDYDEVLEVHLGACDLPDADGVLETKSSAQRVVVEVGVVIGDALRVPYAVRSYRQFALVPEKNRRKALVAYPNLFFAVCFMKKVC